MTTSFYVRIPGWTGEQVMAGDLYRFLDPGRASVTLKVKGRVINPSMVNGHAKIRREWSDSIELSLRTPVRRILADSRLKNDAGLIALERGPLVYCAEWAACGGHALNLVVRAESN